MTVKRFTMDNEVGMLDVPCCNIYDNGEFLGTVILSDGVKFSGLLNEQHEQIHFLNMKYAERTSIIGEQSLKIENLEKENEQLKQQLNYIQNSINEHIKHQKTELGQKALKEIIEDYNEWLLGHKELKE